VCEPFPLEVGQAVTVFRSRLRLETADDYYVLADVIESTARSLPGFVDVKTFTAEDGERVTVATFADRSALEEWRVHDAHVAAQQRGRDEFYVGYSIQTGTCDRVRRWTRP
jgi:heme-degrading monooxygenase HmoA